MSCLKWNRGGKGMMRGELGEELGKGIWVFEDNKWGVLEKVKGERALLIGLIDDLIELIGEGGVRGLGNGEEKGLCQDLFCFE